MPSASNSFSQSSSSFGPIGALPSYQNYSSQSNLQHIPQPFATSSQPSGKYKTDFKIFRAIFDITYYSVNQFRQIVKISKLSPNHTNGRMLSFKSFKIGKLKNLNLKSL